MRPCAGDRRESVCCAGYAVLAGWRRLPRPAGWRIPYHDTTRPPERPPDMDLLAAARQGFATIDADPALKEKALDNLGTWLTHPDFAAYRPQLEWLIQTGEVVRAARLLLPGPAVRHRRPARGGRHRPEPHEPLDPRGQRPGALRVPPPAVPRRRTRCRSSSPTTCGSSRTSGGSTTRDLPNPVLHLSSRDFCQYAAGVYAANGIHVAHPAAGQQAVRRHAGAVVHHPPPEGARRAEHDRQPQPARRQRRASSTTSAAPSRSRPKTRS